jgi:putative membrane protein
VAFLAPIAVGLLAPAHPLSATTGQASSLGALQLASHVSSGSGDSFGSWITALADHPDPGWWAGQHVTLVGFVAQQSGLPVRSVIIGRYLVTCCVVDATLLGFPVQLDRGPLPAEGAWVQVEGVFGRYYWTDPGGTHYPLIEHARVVPATVPSSPYLSP